MIKPPLDLFPQGLKMQIRVIVMFRVSKQLFLPITSQNWSKIWNFYKWGLCILAMISGPISHSNMVNLFGSIPCPIIKDFSSNINGSGPLSKHCVRCSQFSFQALRTRPQGCQWCQKIKIFIQNQILAVWSANIQWKLKKRQKRQKWPKKPLFVTIFWNFTHFQLNFSAANQQIPF